jgi:hypothetical protein
VFSQAEIESIGLQAQSRLRLIDAFLPPQQQVSAEVAGAAKVRSATAEIKNMLAEIDDINEKTVELLKLQAQLEETKTQTAVRGQFHKEIETHRKALAELTPMLAAARVRSETIGRAADRLSAWAERLDSTLEAKPNVELWTAEADWNAVDSLMQKALAAAEKVARYKHVQLSSVRLAGDISGKMDDVTLDEVLVTVKQEWAKLSPLIDLDAVEEPEPQGVENRLPPPKGH